MKPLLLMCCLCLAAVIGAAQMPRPNQIPLGTIAFFKEAETTQMASTFGMVSRFTGYEDVHALVVPPFDMDKLPPGNTFLIEVWMDGVRRGMVEIALPPPGPMDDGIAFPLYPLHSEDYYPDLIGLMDLLLDAPYGKRSAHSFTIRVALAAGQLYLGEGSFVTDADFFGDRLKKHKAPTLQLLPAPQPCDAETMDFLTVRLRLEFLHLSLVKGEFLAAWQPDAPDSKGYSCQVRYVVKDKAGYCYEGTSVLRRFRKKSGEMGVIAGYLWPNRLVGCE